MKAFGYDDLFESTKTRETIGLVIFVLAVIIPTLEYHSFMPGEILKLSEQMLYIVAACGAVLALFIINHKRILANLIVGPLFGIAVVFATGLYIANRESILRIEIAIPLLLGGLPALVVYYFFVKHLYKSNPKKKDV